MSDAGNSDDRSRLIEVTLDEASIRRSTADIDHERKVAIFDLIEDNHFRLAAGEGPYSLRLSIEENRLVFSVGDADQKPLNAVMLSLTPFRKIVKDYFFVCESYYQAIKTAPPSRIEALDMGRRGLHDEGSRLLMERLEGKIEVDFPTARRLFTLICVLHWKG
ncbi:MAG: UPF0262 family protein [Pseudomonadota bacterium]|nr:UPF0262 family protein [Pseudomonadota bacterium]